MLRDRGIEYSYREYIRDPLSVAELDDLFRKLELHPRHVLRKSDKAFREVGLTGEETSTELIEFMAERPTLLQRPIGVDGERAVVARPVAKLLELVET